MSEIRLARPDEYVAVGALTIEAYSAGGVLVADDDYATVLADADGRAAVAEVYVLVDDAGSLVGTVTLSPHGTPYAQVSRPGELEFRMLAVDPKAGGQGYGTRLVAFCAERGRARGFAALVICVIESNTSALRLYDRLGFLRQPDRDKDAGPGVHLLTLTFAL
ncbi:MAG TPA: GNAT family N-acetyltransferase [Actinomycetes bacterium]